LSKPRVIKDFDKVDDLIISQIKLNYPHGFEKHLVSFKNAKGKFKSVLPFEAEDRFYLIRMTAEEAKAIVKKDADYDDEGHLKAKAVKKIQKKIESKSKPDSSDEDVDGKK